MQSTIHARYVEHCKEKVTYLSGIESRGDISDAFTDWIVFL